MSQKGSVYGLVDPRTNEIKYVGRSQNPEIRYSAHINGGGNDWCKDMVARNIIPEFVILEECDDVVKAETFWIRLLKKQLTNVIGGSGKIGTGINNNSNHKSVPIDEDIHRRLKLHCAKRGLLIKVYVREIIEKALQSEEKKGEGKERK